MGGILKGRTEAELRRQAGILGKTVKNNAQLANAIVNGSFRVEKVGSQSTFSDRIWQYQDIMRQDLGKLLQQGLIQGKGARAIAKDLKKYWYGNDPKTGGGAKYCMERLMRTELARVQTEAQKQSFIRNGFEYYEFICNHNGNTCPICSGLNGKHFKVEKMMPGDNAPPMHPNCRCSTAAWEDDEEYEAWLDYLDKGGTTEEWNKKKQSIAQSKKKLDYGVFSTYNITNADSIRPKSIMNEMNRSELGRSLMEYLEKENVPVHLCYGVDNPNGNLGTYDPFDDVITIFCDVTKTTKDTASTLVHEATHRKLGCQGTFDEEVECFKAELIHKKGLLTDSDIEAIMEHVKKYYPELE
jgi:SPP1 gp7 family putative phage head morphogenesis protein